VWLAGFASQSSQQFVPRAFQGDAQADHHVDAGLLLARFQRLEVAMGDVGLLCQLLLGEALVHAQAHEVASENSMNGGHPARMAGQPGGRCAL
jgi:hypothetical protein